MADRVVLAYSGGLDTSVAIKWIHDQYGLDVVALTIDLGANDRDLQTVRERALKIGAVDATVVDARQLFVDHFVWPALQAGALYEGVYPLATALARPLIAYLLVKEAEKHGAGAVAHGCTGKGNDQVRFDVSVQALNPSLRVIAPIREWSMNREDEIEYAARHDIPIPATKESPYSTDQNLWGRSIEGGALEDPWQEPPEEVYDWTVSEAAAPTDPRHLELEFEKGKPVALDGERLEGPELISRVNALAGAHGIGRIDHVENRLVGIKSREVYEAPAAVVLHQAHQALEGLTMTRDAAHYKAANISPEYARLVYNGLWFSELHKFLAAFVAASQECVSGTVRVRLSRGTSTVVGRQSGLSLYSEAQATYGRGDQFDHTAAEGFIKLYGLPLRTQSEVQRLGRGLPALELPPG
ncbi:MAG TPA: argininosuccinate synthase [Chloroflexota bacterium]|nr:argininosuccinate synthase [Chloroflexota bacterium]